MADYKGHTGEDLSVNVYIVPDCSSCGHNEGVRHFWETRSYKAVYVDYASNKGKGGAIRSAMKLSKAPFVLYTDWDFPYTEEAMEAVIVALKEGADVVIAERQQESYLRVIPLKRKVLSRLSHLFNCILLRLPSVDTQGGLKGLSARGRETFLETGINRFLFDTEFIALSVRRKLLVRVVSACIRPDIKLSNMKPCTLMKELGGLRKIFYARWLS